MGENVVSLQVIEDATALITMKDEENKNTLTDEMICSLSEAFQKIEKNEQLKVVVLSGYGNYFSTGGSKKSLIAINEGEATFNGVGRQSDNIYSLPLQCSLPVISAMQGHAIGGGFALGLFGDFILISRESIYAASFMKYGFTPGFGSTYIFPLKLGICLGEDLLLSARAFHGSDLEKRGVPFEVYSRSEVLPKALELAEVLSEKPRKSLILLKDHLTSHIKERLPQIIKEELRMHEETFHLPEVKERILDLY